MNEFSNSLFNVLGVLKEPNIQGRLIKKTFLVNNNCIITEQLQTVICITNALFKVCYWTAKWHEMNGPLTLVTQAHWKNIPVALISAKIITLVLALLWNIQRDPVRGAKNGLCLICNKCESVNVLLYCPQIVAVQKWNELSGTKMLASNVHPQYTKPYILNLNDSVNESTREIKMHLLKKPSHFRLVLVF